MRRLKINGGNKLKGKITISGAKNSAVALIPAAILSDGIVTIDNVPNITDVEVLKEILEHLGAKVTDEKERIIIDCTNIQNREIPEVLSKKLRASYYFMGALLGKYKEMSMYFPGGCSIGARPINIHLKGFEELGANIHENHNKYRIKAANLKGSHIYLDFPSVGATINIMLAAVKADGKTIIENAAREPEIVNMSTFLNNMGANIRGAGTSEITIIGVQKLGDCFIEVIPDRIEAGTYLIAGALCGEDLEIKNIIPEHIDALIIKLKEMGVPLKINEDSIIVSAPAILNKTNIKTQGYPGFPTDLQQPFSVLLTQATGTSKIEETIYENRFKHANYLNKMGANTTAIGQTMIINGKTILNGCEVSATDLRAGAAMILAGLLANGTTYIYEIEHILRGYENIVKKLEDVGAKIIIEEI